MSLKLRDWARGFIRRAFRRIVAVTVPVLICPGRSLQKSCPGRFFTRNSGLTQLILDSPPASDVRGRRRTPATARPWRRRRSGKRAAPATHLPIVPPAAGRCRLCRQRRSAGPRRPAPAAPPGAPARRGAAPARPPAGPATPRPRRRSVRRAHCGGTPDRCQDGSWRSPPTPTPNSHSLTRDLWSDATCLATTPPAAGGGSGRRGRGQSHVGRSGRR